MNPFLKTPLLAATLALPMLLSSCVVDGYAYREPYGGGYYADDDYYPVRYGRSYYNSYPYGYGGYGYGYPYGYYGGGAILGSSYYYRNRYYDGHRYHHDHDHDGDYRRYYSSSGSNRSRYDANRQVQHGDHYHSSQLKKSQHEAMIRRGDSTPSSRTVSRSSSSSKSKGGVSARERHR